MPGWGARVASPVGVEFLLEALARAGLLSPGRLAAVEKLRAALPSDSELASELTRRGWLTPLQARWLGRGLVPVIGPYVLVRRIGRGGTADVHLARHRYLRRFVALKTLRVRSPVTRARFLRECEALGRLDHPNVVHAYDAGEDRGVPWVAMEYSPGPDLGKAATGPLDVGRACEYARQAALGLAHLHDRGIVHRDVKPSNLSLNSGGRVVKVLDVGLARPRWAAAGSSGLTRTGITVGTPDYAAPEQIMDARRVGPKADQYGLGATLYWLLAGQVPFPGGPPVARAVRRLTENPVPLGQVRSNLPARVCAVVGRLLARRPKERFASMAEVVTVLSPFASVAPLPARDTVAEVPALAATATTSLASGSPACVRLMDDNRQRR